MIVIVYLTELEFTPDKKVSILKEIFFCEILTKGKKLHFILPTNRDAYPDGVKNPRFFEPTIRENRGNIPFGLKVNISIGM